MHASIWRLQTQGEREAPGARARASASQYLCLSTHRRASMQICQALPKAPYAPGQDVQVQGERLDSATAASMPMPPNAASLCRANEAV